MAEVQSVPVSGLGSLPSQVFREVTAGLAIAMKWTWWLLVDTTRARAELQKIAGNRRVNWSD